MILVIALLVFGPRRLPELARSLGKGLAEFRRASSDLRDAVSAEPGETKRGEGPAQAGSDAPQLPTAKAAGDGESRTADAEGTGDAQAEVKAAADAPSPTRS